MSDPVISGGPPRSREALRFAVELYAGSGQSEQAAVRAADHFSNWLASCPPEPADTTVVGLLHAIIRNQEIIMSEDASVLAVVTDETAQVAALGTAVGALQALVVNLQAQPATALQPGTLAALQAAQASLDTLAATGAADVTADSPQVVPPVTS